MKTFNESFKEVGSSVYYGERGDWLVAYALHRYSDCLSRSNWRVLLKILGGESENVAIERAPHWAWIDYLLINPADILRVDKARQQLEALENYPILDESDFSEEEMKEANEIWANFYREKDRIEYVRAHRSQFEFRDFGDLLGCIRGRYFAGYASELIS